MSNRRDELIKKLKEEFPFYDLLTGIRSEFEGNANKTIEQLADFILQREKQMLEEIYRVATNNDKEWMARVIAIKSIIKKYEGDV